MRRNKDGSIMQTALQQQQQQQNKDGNTAQQIFQQNRRTMQAHMTGRGQLTPDGYVPEAAQNGIIIMLYTP